MTKSLFAFILLVMNACGSATSDVSEEGLDLPVNDDAFVDWSKDYSTAFYDAKQNQKKLFIYFRHPVSTPAREEFETKTLMAPAIQSTLSNHVRLLVNVDAKQSFGGGIARPLVSYFPLMFDQHGYLIIDFSVAKEDAGYGMTVAEYPFVRWDQNRSSKRPVLAALADRYKPWTESQMSAVLNQSGTGFIRRQQQFVAFVNGNGGQNNNQNPLNPPGPTPPRDQPDTGFPEVAQQMLAESNRIRNSWGLESQVLDAKLVAAAQRHADDMATRGFLDHTGSDGSSVGRRVMDAGFRFSLLAENIAVGQPSVSDVFVGWVNSSGHNENMRRNATLAGFASAKRGGLIYWVSVYASPMR